MKLTYGIWEGDPTLLAEYEDGRINGYVKFERTGWKDGQDFEVFTKSSVLSKELFDKIFPNLTLPTIPDEQVGEVQMAPPGILEEEGAGGGHKFNEEWRKLPKESPRKGELAAKMRARYAGVVAKLPPEWSGVIASLDLLPKI
jgi:hypothetical protein